MSTREPPRVAAPRLMQKLLYLAHMYHFGIKHEPLMDGKFEAWNLGPVEPTLYQKVKAYGGNPVVDIFACHLIDSGDEYDSIYKVYDSLKNVSTAQLVKLTHMKEGAWAKNYKPNIYGISISDEDIIDEFKKRFK